MPAQQQHVAVIDPELADRIFDGAPEMPAPPRVALQNDADLLALLARDLSDRLGHQAASDAAPIEVVDAALERFEIRGGGSLE